MNDPQLEAEVREVLELAGKATPGPWMMATDWERAAVMQKDHPYTRVVCTGNQNNSDRHQEAPWSGSTWADAAFIAKAPLMADLIKRLYSMVKEGEGE